MLNLIALFSCQSLLQASTEPTGADGEEIPEVIASAEPERPAPVVMPSGSAVVRECYGGSDREKRSSSTNKSPPRSVGSAPGGGAAPSAATSQPAPPPASPMATAGPGQGGLVGGNAGGGSAAGYGSGGAKGESGARRPAERAPLADATPSVAYDPSPAPEAAAAGPRKSEADRTESKKETARMDAPADGRGKAKDEKARPMVQEAEESPMADDQVFSGLDKSAPAMDWGATVYLSNDDSMSLASAQRLLWAIQNRGAVATSQVRPHELLNYFSFDTEEVARGDTFSVKAGAEQTGAETLTFAFAVKGVVPSRKPLDLTMVLDRSGSMSAEGRMDYLKRGLSKMSESLVRGDRVDLVLFDDRVCTPLEGYVVGRDDPSLLSDAIAQLAPRGSTDLDSGLKEGYRIANARSGSDVKGRNRRMMLISDALLNTGDVDVNTVSEVGKAFDSSGIRLTAIGVGRDFNDKVLDKLSEKGKGAYVYLGSEAVVDRVFGLGFNSLTRTIAHDVKFALDLPPSLAMERFYGEESSTDPDDIQPIHYYAGTTQLFLQDLKMRGGRASPSDSVTLTVEFRDADTGEPEKQVFTATVGSLMGADPRNLRKGRTLMAWTDLILARSMGGSPCGAPFTTWQERVGALGDDAEVAWLDGLTSPLCGQEPRRTEPMVARGVTYKVKVDSDLPIAEVTLACGSWRQTQPLASGDTVAKFAAASTGSCTLTLEGNVPMRSSVEVPSTGGDVRCTVRGGRVSCG